MWVKTGPANWYFDKAGKVIFPYVGPDSSPTPPEPASPKVTPVVHMGDRDTSGLPAALAAVVGQPNLTGALRRLSREFGTVTVKDFIDTAEAAGVNRHTATKQVRLGRNGVE
jgi:hypothetical protein